MQSELKPCPFCGSDRLMVLPPTCDRSTPYNPADRAFPVIRCGGCYTDVPGRDFDASGKSAVEAWNRRAALSAEQALPIRVKPMEWRREAPYHVARVFGNFYAVEAWDGGVTLSGIPGHRDFKTVEAAKAAAQSDYETRIRSALVDVPAVIPTANCCICGRIIDTREKKDGGDDFGAETAPGKWTCSMECDDAVTGYVPDVPAVESEPVGEAGEMPGSNGGFTMAVFKASDVPLGTKLFTSPPLTREGEDSAEVERLTRPIVGIEHRTAQEVFDIMADRIRLAATRSGSATSPSGKDS